MLALKLKENKPEYNTKAASGVNRGSVQTKRAGLTFKGSSGANIFFWSLSISPMLISSW